MEYVKKIANADKKMRRDAVLDILREHNIPYRMYGETQGSHYTENIIVSLNPQKRRYVIGAHYDNVEGSIGAVDNASGVSVLLRLLFALYGKTDRPVDFVFFDREEYEDRGSETYVNAVGREHIIAMLNLDPCGYGDTIAVHKMSEESVEWLDALCDDRLIREFPVKPVDFMPNGDHMTFYGNQIPTFAISTVSGSLADCLNEISKYGTYGDADAAARIPQKVMEDFMNAYDMTTFHNGENDKLETVSQEIMDALYQYLIAALAVR